MMMTDARITATLFLTADLAWLTEPQVRAKVRECAAAGFDLIIPTLAAEHGRSYVESRVLPPLTESRMSYRAKRTAQSVVIRPQKLDIFDVLLDECDRTGVAMFLPTGTLSPEKPGSTLMWPYPPSQWFTPKLRDLNVQFVQELALRYGAHSSLAGWYISDEMKWSIDEQQILTSAIASACRAARPGLPILMSPSPLHTSERTRALGEAEQVAKLHVDILCPMDAGELTHRGAGPWDDATFARIESSHAETSAACKACGKRYWSNVELFYYDHESHPGVPFAANPERVRRQIEIAARYAQRVACFQYFTLAEPPGSQVPLGGSAELHQLISSPR